MNCTYRCLTSKPLTTCRFVQRARRDTLEEEISNKRREPRSTQASPPLSTWKAKTLLQDACCEMGREDWLCEHVWRSRRTRAQAGKSLEGIRTLLRRKAWTLPRRHDWLMTGPSHVQLLQSPQARTKPCVLRRRCEAVLEDDHHQSNQCLANVYRSVGDSVWLCTSSRRLCVSLGIALQNDSCLAPWLVDLANLTNERSVRLAATHMRMR